MLAWEKVNSQNMDTAQLRQKQCSRKRDVEQLKYRKKLCFWIRKRYKR